MIRIRVPASRQYDVLVATSLLDSTGTYLQGVLQPGCNIAIISDSQVWPLYGNSVRKSLIQAGFQVVHYVVPAGESSKKGSTYLEILNFLAENRLTRSDALLALGGGVVGDITGFAAATYMRGIAYIQVPTTLLAMVDASVGGKTAIDLPAGKNLAGVIYQPLMVLCDPEVLHTLPQEVFCDGCAEIIKYGMLYDAELFAQLKEDGLEFDPETVVSKCISLKRDVVCTDEFDTGVRQKLNFGHTVGHSIEALSDYHVSHGQAVAIGMRIVTKAAVLRNLCDPSILSDLLAVLQMFRLPCSTEYTAKQLWDAAVLDKKRTGNRVNLVIPRAIGNCEIISTSLEDLEAFIQEGL